MERGEPSLGRYLVSEMYECDPSRLDDESLLREACVAAALGMGARVVGRHSHRYHPVGVTVVVLLAESHLVFHTWPQQAAASVDIFVCRDLADPGRARDVLARAVSARRVTDFAVRRP